jgi:phage terminase large subunit-like protein
MTRTLSNTAVPVHYAAFREKVLSGEIPVCQEISLEMQRIDELIKRPDVFYDPGAIDGWCEFVEVELTLTDGEKVHLLDSFKLWAEQLMSPIRTAIQRSEGPLFKMLTFGSKQNTTGNPALRQQLSSTKKGIELFATNSLLEVRPMSIDKVQGLRTKYNSVDEWLSGDTRENVITALMQGARKFEDPILVAISSEGTIRNGVGDDIKLELAAILRGELQEDNVSIFHYKLDNVQEVGKPEKWLKCNPNLGITVSYETYKQDVEKAELFPHIRNEILAKRFGLPMEGTTYFFTYEETLPTFATVHPTRYSGMECCLGIDLSRGDDFCAFTFLFPLGQGRFGLKTRSYISRRTLDLLSGSKRIKYESFREEGTLIVLEGNTLDMMEVYDDLFDHVEQLEYIVVAVGYDVYWERDNGPQGIYKVPQGARTESVPLGEMKTQVAAKVVEFDEKIMMYTMGHAVAKEDLNGNRMLVKLRNEEKIDNVSAWMDAYVAYKRDPEMFD